MFTLGRSHTSIDADIGAIKQSLPVQFPTRLKESRMTAVSVRFRSLQHKSQMGVQQFLSSMEHSKEDAFGYGCKLSIGCILYRQVDCLQRRNRALERDF
jgi:hypothetical protein